VPKSARLKLALKVDLHSKRSSFAKNGSIVAQSEPHLLPRGGPWRESDCGAVLSPVEDCMKALIHQLIRNEQGQDLIEYGVLIGIITAGAVTFINPIGRKVSTYFSNLNSNLP
jgi:Flp pilus assembly pilin Flp